MHAQTQNRYFAVWHWEWILIFIPLSLVNDNFLIQIIMLNESFFKRLRLETFETFWIRKFWESTSQVFPMEGFLESKDASSTSFAKSRSVSTTDSSSFIDVDTGSNDRNTCSNTITSSDATRTRSNTDTITYTVANRVWSSLESSSFTTSDPETNGWEKLTIDDGNEKERKNHFEKHFFFAISCYFW